LGADYYSERLAAFVNLIWPLLILSFGPTWPLVAPAGADASV
jgi:hypothetical protein